MSNYPPGEEKPPPYASVTQQYPPQHGGQPYPPQPQPYAAPTNPQYGEPPHQQMQYGAPPPQQMQSGAPPPQQMQYGAPPPQQMPYGAPSPQQMQYGAPPPQQIDHTGQTVVLVTGGGCPRCHAGTIVEDYPAMAWVLAVCFFPIGVLCCLAMKERRCTNCRAEFQV